MVFVKVRETYDLHTARNKMSVIAIHTPEPSIIKLNYPGLLMQCKSYRPVSADVTLACASMLPVDPLGVGTTEGDIAPEDLFNPLLYSAMSNFGMSQLEARIALMGTGQLAGTDIDGKTANVDADSFTSAANEFDIYYGLLSNAHGWKHANPQSGLQMRGLRPLVYEMLYNIGDQNAGSSNKFGVPAADGSGATANIQSIRGNGKPIPWINCSSYSEGFGAHPFLDQNDSSAPAMPSNHEIDVPWINCVVGAVIVPPSRLHELFYRMVVEWTIEFSGIRPFSEITTWNGLAAFGTSTHYKNYDYSATKEALTGDRETILTNDTTMVSGNVDLKKIM